MVKKNKASQKPSGDTLDFEQKTEKQTGIAAEDCCELAAQAEPPNTSDIVCDILALIKSKTDIDPQSLEQIDGLIRERWGGDRVWVSKKAGHGMSFRNEAIRRDYWQRGERISLLARRYQISTRRIWEILKS